MAARNVCVLHAVSAFDPGGNSCVGGRAGAGSISCLIKLFGGLKTRILLLRSLDVQSTCLLGHRVPAKTTWLPRRPCSSPCWRLCSCLLRRRLWVSGPVLPATGPRSSRLVLSRGPSVPRTCIATAVRARPLARMVVASPKGHTPWLLPTQPHSRASLESFEGSVRSLKALHRPRTCHPTACPTHLLTASACPTHPAEHGRSEGRHEMEHSHEHESMHKVSAAGRSVSAAAAASAAGTVALLPLACESSMVHCQAPRRPPVPGCMPRTLSAACHPSQEPQNMTHQVARCHLQVRVEHEPEHAKKVRQGAGNACANCCAAATCRPLLPLLPAPRGLQLVPPPGAPTAAPLLAAAECFWSRRCHEVPQQAAEHIC